MKISILLDSKGNVVGAARPAAAESAGAGQPEVVAGLLAQHGQTVHEIEVADELLKPGTPDLLKRLAELEAVKGILANQMTAGLLGPIS